MQTVIIAGGKGTRLDLKEIPKPMAKIGEKPILQHQIELAQKYGSSEIFILAGFLGEKIEEYLKENNKFKTKIHYVKEDVPLGTAGALNLIKDSLEDRFLVFYGDIFMNFDVENLINFDLKHKNSIGTLAVHPNNHPYDSDLVQIDRDNKITQIHFKPHQSDKFYQNLGIAAVYSFSKEIFKYIEKDRKQDLVKDVINKALQAGENLYAYNTPEYIKDIGTKDRLEQAQRDYEFSKPEKMHRNKKRPCIFLDRDGVINPNMDTNPTVSSFKLLNGVGEAIERINNSGYLAIVVTNQPMAAKGLITIEEIEETHKKMATLLGEKRAYLDGIYYCPHHNEKGFEGEIKELKIDCDCRKPKAGMLYKAKEDFNIDLKKSFMIGDSERDLIAGKTAGCKTVFISDTKSDYADFYAENLLEAVKLIINKFFV